MNDTPDNDPIETELEADIAQSEADAEAGLNAHPEDGSLDPLDAVIAERDQWRDRALRAAAEAENVKRRTEAQMNDARAYAIQRFARDLLSVADTLERGLGTAPKDADGPVAAMVTGLELTQKALLTAFETNGLKRVEPQLGDAFDPNFHQAMMEQPSTEAPGGTVIQTLQPGYELFGRTVRPAMVVVAAKGSGGGAYGENGGASGGHFDGKA